MKNINKKASRQSQEGIYLLIAMIFIMIFSMNNVIAATSYKQNEAIDLKIPCINNNTYCSGSATCNISIYYPNETILIDNKLMTNKGAYHNYSLSAVQTSAIGNFNAVIVCIDGDAKGYTFKEFIITPTGREIENNSSSIVIGLAILMILFLVASYVWESKQWMMKSAFIALSMMIGLILANTIKTMAEYQFSGMGMSGTLTSSITLVTIALYLFISYLFIYLTVTLFKMISNKKKIAEHVRLNGGE